jgi:glycosyltransferase involved in cell wall biosynthesis
LRRLFEPRQGLSHARNRAVAAARGEALLWTDDDVLVEPDWLTEYVKAARDWPAASCFGGPIEPDFAVAPPPWVERHLDLLADTWALLSRDPGVRPGEPDEMFHGANMAFRTAVL